MPSQLDVEVRNAPETQMDPKLEKSSSIMHHYLVGQLAFIEEDFDGAIDNFESASQMLDAPVPDMNARLAELYVRSGKLPEALLEIEKALLGDPDNTSYMLMRAGIVESTEDASKAVPLYREIIQKNPDLIDAKLLLADLYVRLGQIKESLVLLKDLAAEKPGEAAIQYQIGRVYEMLEDLDQAEHHMRKAWKLKPENEGIVAQLIKLLLRKKDITGVKKVCTRVLEMDPENSLARRILGEMAIGEGQLDEALSHLQVIENDDAHSSDARYKIALIHIEQQNYKEAERELLLVIAANPGNSSARYYLASILAGSGRKREAVGELFKIEPGQEMYAKSRTFAAFLLRQDGDFEMAEKAVREALEAEPDNSKTLAYLILILRDARKFDAAAELLEDAIKDDPKNDSLHFNYSIVLHDLGQQEKSLRVMEKVIELNPANADALNYVAYSLSEQEDSLERAEKLVGQALELRPNDGYFLDTLGWIFFKQGRFNEAMQTLGRAVSLTGDDIVILEHYGEAAWFMNDVTTAVEVYSKALELAKAKGEDMTKDEQDSFRRVKEKMRDLAVKYPALDIKIPE